MKFKVGDRVISNQPGQSYTGTIQSIGKYIAIVWRDDKKDRWSCKIVGDKIATARGMWDEESYLELAKDTPKFSPPFYVTCPTKEIWKKVTARLLSEGFRDVASHRGFDDGVRYVEAVLAGGEKRFFSLFTNGVFEPGSKAVAYQEFLGEKKGCDLGTSTCGTCNKRICLCKYRRANGTRDYEAEQKDKEQWTFKYEGPLFHIPKPTEFKWSSMEMFEKEHGGGHVEVNPFYKFTHSLMDTLRSIPNRLKKALNASLQACYKLGWIDGDLDVTEEGKDALMDFLFDKFETEMGAVAKAKIKELNKSKKSKDGEEDED